MPYEVVWSATAVEHLDAFFDYVAENASLWDAENLCARLLQSTDKLTEFPRLYEAAPQYGEGVRRISLLGCHVLYEVDEPAHLVNVLAVVGQRQQPRMVR